MHLEGEPAEVGFQHGYLLAPEIQDAQRMLPVVLKRDSKKDWGFYREAAQNVLWPHIEQEYREELQGITEGLRAKNVKVDLWDVVAANAWLELGSYYSEWYDKQNKTQSSARAAVPEHCSAFVATGSYTKDGKVVIGHNNWSSYLEGARWNIIFDIKPARGHRILMDGFAGAIHSADDFAINSGGHPRHGDDHLPLFGLGFRRNPRIRAGPQGGAVLLIHRRLCAHHEGGEQRRLREQLAGGGPQD